MAGRWSAAGGWMIEAIVLGDRPCYRVSRRGYLIGDGYCYHLVELERLLRRHGIALGDLTEEGPPAVTG
ncbi:hypothetical protein NE235_25965 [Actinoallomurus spadix]|nr:hypothetical protein [Actinoallomurus spadix]MCO5989560.1 hypothetical protein [Actinoallomurus spadix]